MNSPELHADDILEMACRIEKNGFRFYSEAAENVSDPEVKKLLKDLARMEKQHEAVFAGIRKEIKEAEKKLPDPGSGEEPLEYCRTLADMHVFNNWKIGSEGVHTILLKALSAEKDTIALFTGLKFFVPERSGRRRINEVIREEMTHVMMLSRKIREMG
jgi:rubrerythrin